MYTLKVVVGAGEASAQPPLGPLLGMYQINLIEFCKDFNQKSATFVLGVPVRLVIKKWGSRYKITIIEPTTFAYFEQLVELKTKTAAVRVYDLLLLKQRQLGFELPKAAKIVFGTLKSMGVRRLI